ncbi:TIR domain-containing protein [Rhizobium brockwellii]|uniref:TIR domain-containing protein n=1 Tax=Rhizobium brockwellii TaxID=3019932 RepID=UPI003F9D82DC
MKIFVGYANEDKEVARDIVAFLEALGLDVWFDKKSLIAGDDWDAERLAAQQAADLIIHICSEQIMARSGVVNREIRETLRIAEDKPFGGTFVIFVRVGGVRLPVSFLRYHYVDYEGDWQQSLMAAIGKKAESVKSTSLSSAPSFKRDSSVSLSEKFTTKTIEEQEKTYSISVEYISYKNSYIYFRMVNSHIEAKVLELYHEFKADIEQADLKEDSEWFRPWEYQVRAEEFYQFKDFISIGYFVYMDTGGAHGNHHMRTSNFFGSRLGKVDVKEILGYDDGKAHKLLTYCLRVVEAGLDEPDPATWLIDQNDTEAVWRVLENFNFDNKGLTFNFSPYDITAYVMGDHEVTMPWQVASGHLIEKFLEPWYQSQLK